MFGLLLLILTFNYEQLNLVFLYDLFLPQNPFCPGVIDTVGNLAMFAFFKTVYFSYITLKLRLYQLMYSKC